MIDDNYLKRLNWNGDCRGGKNPKSYAPISKAILDDIVHIECCSNLSFGVKKCIITVYYATYVQTEVEATKPIPSQQIVVTMPGLQNSNQQ